MFTAFVKDILQQQDNHSHEELAGYIVGELLGNPDGKYGDLYEQNQTVQRIGDIASDLERSNGSEQQLQSLWDELQQLAASL